MRLRADKSICLVKSVSSLLAFALFWVAPVYGQPAALASRDAVDQGANLAKAKNCLGCHQIDAKRVGPGLIAVSQRYAAINDPAQYLAQSIQKGGAGRWGAVPMPAQPHVSDADAQTLANWILSLSTK